MEIQYINLHLLNEREKSVLQGIIEDGSNKIERMLKDPSKFVVQVKLINATGKRKEYEITARVESPSATFSTDCVEWDLRKVSHEVIIALEKEITHRYKKDTSHKKPYA